MKKINFLLLFSLLFAQIAFSQEKKATREKKDFTNPLLQTPVLKSGADNADFASAVLDSESEPITFTQSGNYPWVVGDGYVTSGNANIDGSSSWFGATIENDHEITLSFEWYSTSETHCDFFNFWINNTLCISHSGMGQSGFTNFTLPLPAGSYTLAWEYNKDVSLSSGIDAAQVRKIKVRYYREPAPEILFNIINGVLVDYLGFGGDVTIPDGVVAIACRFNSLITSVSIPASVTTIGQYAFASCYDLQEITVQWEVPLAIHSSVFEGVNKRNCLLNVPEGSSEAYETADVWKDFFSSSGFVINANGVLTGYNGEGGNILIPNNVTAIADGAFSYNSGITSVKIPAGVTGIGSYAFTSCSSLRSFQVSAENPAYSSSDGVLYNKAQTMLVTYPYGKTESSFTLPEQVEAIGDYAFAYSYLSSVNLSENLTRIGYQAFMSCRNLSSLSIPEQVTAIDHQAFAECSNLRTITVSQNIPLTINGDVFSNVNLRRCVLWVPQDTKAAYSKALVWSQFRYIKEAGEEFNPNILDFEIDDKGVLTQYYGAGGNVVIPEGVTAINESVFYYGWNITAISIPGTVTSIGYAAFANCYNLTNLFIPGSVTTLGNYAFANCPLRTITVEWTTPPAVSYSVFEGVNRRNCTLIVPDGSLEAYQKAAVWKNFLDNSDFEIDEKDVLVRYYGEGGDVVVPEGVSAVADYVFQNNYNLTSVTLPNTVTSIGNYAFAYCSSLNSIVFPENLEAIGSEAFINCSSLNSVVLPKNLTYLAAAAFGNCTNLSAITLPENLTSIGNYALGYCINLRAITLPENLKIIGSGAFASCTSLTDISIPPSVDYIDYDAFCYCYNLSQITVHWIEPLDLWNDIFAGVDKNVCKLRVPAGTKSAYRSAFVWKEFLNIDEAPPVAISTVNPDGIIVNVTNNTLKINSPIAEKISVYSVEGKLIHREEKPAGEFTFSIESSDDKVLIVKGSSGWVKKTVR